MEDTDVLDLRKQLKKYVKEQLDKSFSTADIITAMINSGYPQYYASVFVMKEAVKHKARNHSPLLMVVFLFIILIGVGKPSITGYVSTQEVPSLPLTDDIGTWFSSFSSLEWEPKFAGQITSLRIDGRVEKQDQAVKVWLIGNDKKYLVYLSEGRQTYGFTGVCMETCNLDLFTDSGLTLVIDAEGAEFLLDKIHYSYK